MDARNRVPAKALPLICIGVFILIGPAAAARPTLTTLYQFAGTSGDGDGFGPKAALVIGANGVLYGTTLWGGIANCPGPPTCGTVFSLTPPVSAGAPWTETVIHAFAGGADGYWPSAALAIGSGGVLYGVATGGGAAGYGGIVFALAPPTTPGGAWSEAILHSFPGGTGSDGAGPVGALVIGDRGVLYGTTESGGSYGGGTAFSLTPPAQTGGPWIESVLWSFGNGGDGADVLGGLTIGDGGVLYGTTAQGGAAGLGTVFSLTPPSVAGEPWTEAVLHSFAGPDGENPGLGTLVTSPGGVLYGTTEYGGAESGGGGTVFSLTPPAAPGGSWTETVLYGFRFNSGDVPFDGVVRNSTTGALYGATSGGGATSRSMGTVFQLTPPASPGGPWTYTDLHSFLPGKGFSNPDGIAPWAGVVIGPDHTLYGTTSGQYLTITINGGTVFSLQ